LFSATLLSIQLRKVSYRFGFFQKSQSENTEVIGIMPIVDCFPVENGNANTNMQYAFTRAIAGHIAQASRYLREMLK